MVGFRSHLSWRKPRNLCSLPRSARKGGRPIGTSSRSQPLEPPFRPFLEVPSIGRTRGCTAKLILGSIHTSWHSPFQRWNQRLNQCNRPRIAKSPEGPTCTSPVAAIAFSPSIVGMVQSLQTLWLQAPEVVRTSRNLRCCSKTALRATGTKLCSRSLLSLPECWEVPWTCSGRSRLDSSCCIREYIPKMDLVPTGTSWHMSTHSWQEIHSRCSLAHTAGRPGEPIDTNQAVQGTVVSTTETGTSSCQSSLRKCQPLKCYEPKDCRCTVQCYNGLSEEFRVLTVSSCTF